MSRRYRPWLILAGILAHAVRRWWRTLNPGEQLVLIVTSAAIALWALFATGLWPYLLVGAAVSTPIAVLAWALFGGRRRIPARVVFVVDFDRQPARPTPARPQHRTDRKDRRCPAPR